MRPEEGGPAKGHGRRSNLCWFKGDFTSPGELKAKGTQENSGGGVIDSEVRDQGIELSSKSAFSKAGDGRRTRVNIIIRDWAGEGGKVQGEKGEKKGEDNSAQTPSSERLYF